MGVPRGQGSARVVSVGQGECQGCPRRSTRTLGVLGGQGGRQGCQGGCVKVSQGVKRGVPGVEGSQGDPRGLRGMSGV